MGLQKKFVVTVLRGVKDSVEVWAISREMALVHARRMPGIVGALDAKYAIQYDQTDDNLDINRDNKQ